MAHDVALVDLIVALQDGDRVVLQRDAADQLFAARTELAAGSRRAGADHQGWRVVGFGPWPTWSSNLSSRTVTLVDDESGLFEPERLFVLREQYMFLAPADRPEAIASLGPIHKAWWDGTEHIVQARRGGRH